MFGKRVRFEEEVTVKDRRWLLEHIDEVDVDSPEELEELYLLTK